MPTPREGKNPTDLWLHTASSPRLPKHRRTCYNAGMLRRLLRVGLTLALLVIVSAAFTFLFICWQINRTGARDQAQQADAIVILGAMVQPDGQPGPDLRSRTLHAVTLYHRGLAPYLICTGGYQGDRLSAASVARAFAVAEGVPGDRIFLADGSMNTREDVERARALMSAQQWHTAILVSHPLHLERARVYFVDRQFEAYPSPTSTQLAQIQWRTRAFLTAREAVGIIWIGLEDLGMPHEWTVRLSRWVYGTRGAVGRQ